MTSPFDSSLLSGYLDGELDAAERAEVERVLEAEPSRRAELESLRRIQQSLQGFPAPQPTVDPVAAVRQRIAASPNGVLLSASSWWLQAIPFALAASLLLAVGWLMYARESDPIPVARERSVARESSPAPAGEALPAAPRPRGDGGPDSETEALGRQATAAAPDQVVAGRAGVERAAVPADRMTQRAPAMRSMKAKRAAPDRPRPRAPAADARFGVPPLQQARRQADDAPALMEGSAARPPAQAGRMLRSQAAGEGRPLVLRYVVPPNQQAAAIRWLRENAAEGLRELPLVGPAEGPAAVGSPSAAITESPEKASDVETPEPPPAAAEASLPDRATSDRVVRRFVVSGDAAAQATLRAALQQRVAGGPGSLEVFVPNAHPASALEAASPPQDEASGDAIPLSFPSTAAVPPFTLAAGTVIELVVRPE